jgi:hypothetical protein
MFAKASRGLSKKTAILFAIFFGENIFFKSYVASAPVFGGWQAF